MPTSHYERKTWVNLPEGLLELTLAAVSDETGKDFDTDAPKPKKKLIWTSHIVGPDGQPLQINQWANDVFAPKSKLRSIAQALSGGRDPDDSINWDHYISRRAQGLIKHVTDERTGNAYLPPDQGGIAFAAGRCSGNQRPGHSLLRCGQ